MYSSDVSQLHQTLGDDEQSKLEFTKKWIEKINPKNGIYYDITSFSSYSTKNEFVECGYNRYKENLPQINLGWSTEFSKKQKEIFAKFNIKFSA